MRLHPRLIATLVLAATAVSPLTHAAVTVGNTNVQVGGFFSQGYLKSSGNNHPFEAKDGTWDFREMGLNVSTTVGSHLRLGAQGFAQRLGNYGDDKVLLDWAVADYNFRPEVGVRVGRIKYPKGLYGEALDLDAIRPFIFLPGSIYSPVLRDFSASFDGAMVYGTLSTKTAGSFDYKVFYGDIAMDPEQGVSDFFADSGYYSAAGVKSLEVDHVAGVALDWSTPINGLKVHLSYSELSDVVGAGTFALAPLPFSIDVSLSYTSIGVEYLYNDWTFAAEWMRQDGDTLIQALPVLNNAGKYGNDNYYVSASRRLGAKWEIGGYYSRSKNSYPTATTPADEKQLDDWALSVRYNVNENVIIKLEAHQIDGSYNILNTARNPNPTTKGDMSYFAAKTTLMF